MALKGDGADASYLNTTSTNASTSFFFTGIFQGSEDDPAGEQDLITFALASPFYYLAIRYDVSGGTRENLRLATHAGYYELAGTAGNASDWFGLGLSCGGTGSTDFVITFQANQAATPVTFTRTMDGGTWTPGYLRLFSGYARGAAAAGQNIKYGNQYRNATQMQQEFWTTSLVNSGGTVVQTEMVTGDVTAQREAFTVSGTVTAVVGPLDSTGGDAPTIAVSTASVSGDEFTISGTYTEDSGGGLAVQILDIVGGSTVQTITPSFSSGTYSATFRATVAGSHTLRASISDSNGTDTDDSSALTVVSLTGADELPYTWDVTGINVVPSAITLENGAVANYSIVDQSGNAIRGVTPTVTGSIVTVGATGVLGTGTLTGTATGTGTLTASVLNAAGSFLSAQASVTVSAATGATVTVSPSTATAATDEETTFAATVTGSTQGVTWSVESGSGSISTDGVYSSTTATTATIRATSVEFPGSYGEATITVSATTTPGLTVAFLSDATQSAQIGAQIAYTLLVTQAGVPVSGATITATPSTSAATLTVTNATTNANGRGSVVVEVLDGSPLNTTITLTLDVDTGSQSASVTGYLQIVELLYGTTELRGVTYARPRARNE